MHTPPSVLVLGWLHKDAESTVTDWAESPIHTASERTSLLIRRSDRPSPPFYLLPPPAPSYVLARRGIAPQSQAVGTARTPV